MIFEAKYPGIVQELYQRADTRDKIKFVRAGLVSDNLVKLVETNKTECQKSVQQIEPSEDNLGSLNEAGKKNLKVIKALLEDQSIKVNRKIYGRQGECMIYTGPNQELYISDELAAYLRENEGYSE